MIGQAKVRIFVTPRFQGRRNQQSRAGPSRALGDHPSTPIVRDLVDSARSSGGAFPARPALGPSIGGIVPAREHTAETISYPKPGSLTLRRGSAAGRRLGAAPEERVIVVNGATGLTLPFARSQAGRHDSRGVPTYYGLVHILTRSGSGRCRSRFSPRV
jgi:hypothetical protein